jgi:hypothetical protein
MLIFFMGDWVLPRMQLNYILSTTSAFRHLLFIVLLSVVATGDTFRGKNIVHIMLVLLSAYVQFTANIY